MSHQLQADKFIHNAKLRNSSGIALQELFKFGSIAMMQYATKIDTI